MDDKEDIRCVDQIPDANYVRDELSRNLRERDILQKLLRLSERKASLIRSKSVNAKREVSNA